MTTTTNSRLATGLSMMRRLAKEPGWKCVANGPNHYVVTAPSKRKIEVEMRPGEDLDDAFLRALDEAGFLGEGKAWQAPDPEQEKPVTAVKAAKEASYDEALKRAASPYLTEPEDVGIAWYAEKHPAPWMRWVWMTPEIAKYLMDHHNVDNRKLRDSEGGTVDYYRDIIVSGQWRLTHQGMAMDTRGLVQDGQHRAWGIIEAGKLIENLRVPVAFFVGMDPDNWTAIDENLLRSAKDLFQKDGEKNPTTLNTTVRLVRVYGQDDVRQRMRQRVSNEAIHQTFTSDAEELRSAANWAQGKGTKMLASNGALGAARYLLRRANGPDNSYVEAFFNGLATGGKLNRVMLDDDDPRRVLRDKFKAAKESRPKRNFPPVEQVAMIIKSWNNLVEGRRPKVLHFTTSMEIPRPMICHDTGPDASACPDALRGEIDAAADLA